MFSLPCFLFKVIDSLMFKTTPHLHDMYPTEPVIAPDHLQHHQPNTAPLLTIRSLCSDNICVELEFR